MSKRKETLRSLLKGSVRIDSTQNEGTFMSRVRSFIEISCQSDDSCDDIINELLKRLQSTRIKCPAKLTCLVILNQLMVASSIRRSVCGRVKCLGEIGEQLKSNSSVQCKAVSTQLKQYVELWEQKYSNHHPQLRTLKKYFHDVLQLDMSELKETSEQELKSLQVSLRTTANITLYLASIESLISILFPFHSKTTKSLKNTNKTQFDFTKKYGINSNCCQDEKYVYVDEFGDVIDDQTEGGDLDCSDDIEHLQYPNGHQLADNFDDIEWEEEEEPQPTLDAKRVKLSTSGKTHSIENHHSNSVLSRLGSIPYTMEINFSTDPETLITEGNECVVSNAKEMGHWLLAHALPKLTDWITTLNEALLCLTDIGSSSNNNSTRNLHMGSCKFEAERLGENNSSNIGDAVICNINISFLRAQLLELSEVKSTIHDAFNGPLGKIVKVTPISSEGAGAVDQEANDSVC